MPQQWSNKAKEIGISALATASTEVGLFNGHPDSSGVEVSGGAYARQALSWGTAPTDGTGFDAGQYVFSLAPATTFTHAVVFNAGGDILTVHSLGTVTINADATGNQEFALLKLIIELPEPI